MTTELARTDARLADTTLPDIEQARAALLHYLGTGDLSQLSGPQRAAMYLDVCRSLGLNSRSRPFDFIEFWDPETKTKKLTFYPRATCADQLAFQHRIRVETVEEKMVGTMYKVVLRGTMPDGRTEENVAYVDLCDRDGNVLRGQRYGDRLMKTFTKCKRRLVLGMVGLNTPADIEDLSRARVVTVDGDGNVIVSPTEEQRHLAEHPEVARAIGEPTFEDHADEGGVPEDLPNQRPDTSRWSAPKRTGPRPTFKTPSEVVDARRRAWFALVGDTSLVDDDERHRFFGQYTATIGWPVWKQTESSTAFFTRATDDETAALMAHTTRLVEGEQQDMLDDARAELDDPSADEEPF